MQGTPVRFGSVCSGVEAASLAFGPIGWEAAWFSEIEAFPSKVLAHHYPTVPNLGDMTTLPERIASGEVESPDVLCGGTPCFTAGQMVLTSSGYRPIEDLQEGDEVVTHRGRLRRVLKTGSKTAPVGILKLVGRPGGVVCTGDHPFLSADWRSQNTRENGRYTRVETCSAPDWVKASDMPGRQWCSLLSVEPTDASPESRLLDERKAMYVAGMYLGDGWTRGWAGAAKKAVILGINDAKYQKFLKEVGEVEHSATRVEGSQCVKVCLGDTKLANWLESNFGKGAAEKTLPAWVLGHRHRADLLRGYLDTDGCAIGSKETANSVSRSLAYGVSDLLNVEGRSSSVSKVVTRDTCVIGGRLVNQRDYYQVRANPIGVCRKARARHGYLMRSAQSWVDQGLATVYNIEVDEDNSFVLDGALVHNCQAFSVAGLRGSLSDARGNLSLTFCEIANAIDTKRRGAGLPPSIVFWENVPGCLSTADNFFGCFLGALAGEDQALEPAGGKWSHAGCVFGPERAIAWRTLDAQHFGVPQRRKRLILVACPLERAHPTQILFEFEGERRDTAPSRQPGQEVTGSLTCSAGGVDENDAVAGFLQPYELANCLTRRMHKGFNTTLDEGHTPVLSYRIAGDGAAYEQEELTAPLMTGTDNNANCVAYSVQAFQVSQSGARLSDVHATLDANMGPRRHNGVLCTAYSTKLHNTQSNGAGKVYEEYTAGLDRNSPPPALLTERQVRRLLPIECERLQGMPDNHTNIPGAADTPRYMAIGNSWPVHMIRWVGRRIDKALLDREALS